MPEDVATEELQWLVLNPEEEQARLEALESVAGDLRFEYLDQRLDAVVLEQRCHQRVLAVRRFPPRDPNSAFSTGNGFSANAE